MAFNLRPGTGINVVTGAVVGVAGQLAYNWDAQREATFAANSANAGKSFSIWKKAGFWVSFGIPVVGLVADMTDFIPIPRQYTEKMVLAGSVLAGQEIVQLMTKKNYHLTYAKGAYTNIAPVQRGASQWRSASRQDLPAPIPPYAPPATPGMTIQNMRNLG